MIQWKEFVFVVLLVAAPLVALSCQPNGQEPNSEPVAAADRVLDKGLRENTKQPWPSAYPQPTSLKGLRSIAVKVYADRGIPSDRMAIGPFAEEIERLLVHELRSAGIALVNEEEAEAILSMNLYLSCETDGPSCGHHTTLELKQWAQLNRDASITVAAVTWGNSYSNGISRNQVYCCLPHQLAADAGVLIKGFVEDFRKANSG